MVFQYRKRSGEVTGASTDNAAYVDGVYFGFRQDPSTPNGTDLSVPKIWDGSVLRNATAPEIAGFAAARATDQNLTERDQATAYLNDNPVQRKILAAIVAVLVDEINIVRQTPTTTLAARTLAQAKTAVLAKISSGAVD